MSEEKEDKECVNCAFNLEADDQEMKCELERLLGKPPSPGCEKFKPK
ncbi:MAG: hypothetical protein ACFFCS_15015 [Candidatus Hodarchaeota archaeon]